MMRRFWRGLLDFLDHCPPSPSPYAMVLRPLEKARERALEDLE